MPEPELENGKKIKGYCKINFTKFPFPLQSMPIIKNKILKNICYTELAYQRINRKLATNLSEKQIEDLILKNIKEVKDNSILKIGKNYYLNNTKGNIKITINSNTFRIITVDKIKKCLN